MQADGSEASKSSSWQSKRRRSVTPDEGWDRRDRKRSRYDDDGTKIPHCILLVFVANLEYVLFYFYCFVLKSFSQMVYICCLLVLIKIISHLSWSCTR